MSRTTTTTTGRIRPPFAYYGGKARLASKIIKLLPTHTVYVEPFGGAASVLLNKPPAHIEVYNDLEGRLTRIFRVLRDHGDEFRRRLAITPYSEVEWQMAAEPSLDEIEQARRDYVRLAMCFGGMAWRGATFGYARFAKPRTQQYINQIIDNIPKVIERLRRVQIMNRPALAVIDLWDSKDTLIYCDPPYLPDTREQGSLDVYSYEMSEADHRRLARRLARRLKSCKAKVALSGYPSDLYDSLYGKWRVVRFRTRILAARYSRAPRIDALWMNW